MYHNHRTAHWEGENLIHEHISETIGLITNDTGIYVVNRRDSIHLTDLRESFHYVPI